MGQVAIGLRPRTGRAVAVVVAGDAQAPQIIARSALDLTLSGVPIQVFHAAQALPTERAAALVAAAKEAAQERAVHVLRKLVNTLRRDGHAVAAVGILGGAVVPPPLAHTLTSHALVHAAEGELFRAALAAAVARLHLLPVELVTRQLNTEVEARLGVDATALRRDLDRLGQRLGPPWRLDHKDAAVAALLALAAADAAER